MTALDRLRTERFAAPADLAAAIQPDDLVYFCANVGDADAQVVLVPGRPPGAPVDGSALRRAAPAPVDGPGSSV